MVHIFIFRLIMILGFLGAAYKLTDWKNWRHYYPTVLFVMVVNLSACLLTYHHSLWKFTPDSFVKSQTILELASAFIILPATTMLFLSHLPQQHSMYHIGVWVLIYAIIEYIDTVLGGISYDHGWSWGISVLFDIVMFTLIRLHYRNPILAWVGTFLVTAIVVFTFGLLTAEMK